MHSLHPTVDCAHHGVASRLLRRPSCSQSTWIDTFCASQKTDDCPTSGTHSRGAYMPVWCLNGRAVVVWVSSGAHKSPRSAQAQQRWKKGPSAWRPDQCNRTHSAKRLPNALCLGPSRFLSRPPTPTSNLSPCESCANHAVSRTNDANRVDCQSGMRPAVCGLKL